MKLSISIAFLLLAEAFVGFAHVDYSADIFDFKVLELRFVTENKPFKTIEAKKDKALVIAGTNIQSNDTNAFHHIEIVSMPVLIEKEQYQLQLSVYCDMTSDENEFFGTNNVTSDGINVLNIEGYTKYGCVGPHVKDFLIWFKSLEDVIIFAFYALVILISTLFLLYGLKIFNSVIFLIGLGAGTISAFEFITKTTTFHTYEGTPMEWAFYAGCLVGGVVIGLWALKLRKFGFFMIGATAGTSFSSYALKTASEMMEVQDPPFLYFLILIGACSLFGGWIVQKTYEVLVIMATSALGGWIVSKIVLGDQQDCVTFGVIGVLALVGTYYQLKQKIRVAKELAKKNGKLDSKNKVKYD